MRINPPGSLADGDSLAFTGTSDDAALGMQGWVRFKAVGGACHIRITFTASPTAVTTDYVLTDGQAEEFFVQRPMYVAAIGNGSDTGTLYWVTV